MVINKNQTEFQGNNNVFANEFVKEVCQELIKYPDSNQLKNYLTTNQDITVPKNNEDNEHSKIPIDNVEFMLTKGDGSCLIHAILTCISSNYRILDYYYREIIGRAFRYFLKKIYNLELTGDGNIMTITWLTDKDIEKISTFFQLNIYCYSINRNLVRTNIPADICKKVVLNSDNNICIFGNGYHFSAIGFKNANNTYNYTLDDDKFNKLCS